MTTLDLDKQRLVEEAMDQAGIETGAAVLLDASNGDILAMASRPNFDPNQVDLTNDAWRNRALKQTAPGSVFKTVVAAAALEEGVTTPEEVFTCDGALGKYNFSCWKQDGHGDISFAQAFAQSCNIAFAKTAMRMNGDMMVDYAARLGLTVKPGWKTDMLFKLPNFNQLDQADPGEVFAAATPKNDEGVLVQTSIGQRDVRISPLQAANMVVAIVNNGKRVESRLVTRITYKNGTMMKDFPVNLAEGEQISRETAAQLRKLMRLVVTEGTGQQLQNAIWPIAGKSGTAQIAGGEINQWFIGYAPYDKPRYVLAVVAENMPASAGSNLAIKAFQTIMDGLAGME
jgi:cell division protein FtsI/penicillin-binding protein 2